MDSSSCLVLAEVRHLSEDLLVIGEVVRLGQSLWESVGWEKNNILLIFEYGERSVEMQADDREMERVDDDDLPE